MSASKQKGTKGEQEVRLLLQLSGMQCERTSPGAAWDLTAWWPKDADFAAPPVRVLATRPDYGSWLFSIEPSDIMALNTERVWHIEVKRYKKFAHHTIFESKFGRSRNG